MADKNLKIIITAVDKASKTLDKISGNTRNLNKDLLKVGATLTTVGTIITGLGINVVNQSAKFEQYRLAMNTLVGDGEKATALFEELISFAKETPFNFEDVLQGSNQLLAMGTATEDVTQELRMLGDVSAGLNVPLDRLVYNFGQVRAQTKLTGVELRDFARAGVPLISTLAEQFNVTESEIQDMVSAGEIGFEDVKEAFITMTSEGGKFNNLMGVLSQTTAGQFEKLKDEMQQSAVALGNALLPAVNSLLQAVIPLVEKFTQFATEHPKLVLAFFLIGTAVLVLGTALVALGTTIISINAVLPVLTTLTGAFGTALAFVAANPIVLIIAGIVALIAAIVYLIKNWETLKTNVIMIWEAMKKLIITNATFIWTEVKRIFGELWKSIVEVWTNIKQSISDNIRWALESVGINVQGIIDWFAKLKSFIDGVIQKFRDLVSAIRDAQSAGSGAGGGGGGGSFQHGGIIPGGAGDPYPALLHGGERVVSRTGVDVNNGGNSGVTVNLTIEGDVNSMDMLDNIVDAVKTALGRENELQQLGVS